MAESKSPELIIKENLTAQLRQKITRPAAWPKASETIVGRLEIRAGEPLVDIANQLPALVAALREVKRPASVNFFEELVAAVLVQTHQDLTVLISLWILSGKTDFMRDTPALTEFTNQVNEAQLQLMKTAGAHLIISGLVFDGGQSLADIKFIIDHAPPLARLVEEQHQGKIYPLSALVMPQDQSDNEHLTRDMAYSLKSLIDVPVYAVRLQDTAKILITKFKELLN